MLRFVILAVLVGLVILVFLPALAPGPVPTSAAPVRIQPTATAPRVPTVTPTPRPSRAEATATAIALDLENLEIISESLRYVGRYLQIEGQIQNTGTKALRFVKVTASFYDKSGQFVGTETAYVRTSGDVLAPDQIGTFTISRAMPLDQLGHYLLDPLLQ